jgi:hypothetical protein
MNRGAGGAHDAGQLVGAEQGCRRRVGEGREQQRDLDQAAAAHHGVDQAGKEGARRQEEKEWVHAQCFT